MKKNNKVTKDKNSLMSYAIDYVKAFLKCILIEAQMEKIANLVFIKGDDCNRSRLNRLNMQHGKLVTSLYYKKLKLDLII